MKYQCSECNMTIKAIVCAKCNAELVTGEIKKDDGNKIKVATCPNACGKIKSPQCCGHDMERKAA
jgi:hypothetical protein